MPPMKLSPLAAVETFDQTSLPDPTGTDLPTPVGTRILIRPIGVKNKTAGGILLADTSVEGEEFVRSIGKILAVGAGVGRVTYADEIAWGPEIKVGDTVLYSKYQSNHTKINGVKCLWLTEDDVIAVVHNVAAIVRV